MVAAIMRVMRRNGVVEAAETIGPAQPKKFAPVSFRGKATSSDPCYAPLHSRMRQPQDNKSRSGLAPVQIGLNDRADGGLRSSNAFDESMVRACRQILPGDTQENW